MHQTIRRGLLGTLFAGGLLALGATAASADTTATGTVNIASETASADLNASTSLGLLGGPAPSNSSAVSVNAGLDLNTGTCLLYTSPSPRDLSTSRMPSSA